MKQRIRVAGIVRSGDSVLLLKRLRGRLEELPVWELPTGKIRFGEQPEEAISRVFYEFLGIEVESVKLADAVTFTGLSGASQLGNLYIVYEVILSGEGKISPTERYSAYKYVKHGEISGLALDDASSTVLEIESGRRGTVIARGKDFRTTANSATVYVDGGSRGNPGPSGVGYYIVDEDGEVLKQGGEFIGFATSRVAEYYALKEGCEQAIELGLKKVRFVSDSLMMVNQMNGLIGVKNKDLIPIYEDIMELLEKLEAYSFTHVKRENNLEADMEVNKVINQHFKSPSKYFQGHDDA